MTPPMDAIHDELVFAILESFSALDRLRLLGTSRRLDRLIVDTLDLRCPSLEGRRLTDGALRMLLRRAGRDLQTLILPTPLCMFVSSEGLLDAVRASCRRISRLSAPRNAMLSGEQLEQLEAMLPLLGPGSNLHVRVCGTDSPRAELIRTLTAEGVNVHCTVARCVDASGVDNLVSIGQPYGAAIESVFSEVTAGLHTLSWLRLDDWRGCVGPLLDLHHLRHLSACGVFGRKADFFEKLGNMRCLECLDLRPSLCGSRPRMRAASLSECGALKTLVLHGFELRDTDMQTISTIPKLEKLDTWRNYGSFSGNMASAATLRDVVVNNIFVENDIMRLEPWIHGIKHLQFLSLRTSPCDKNVYKIMLPVQNTEKLLYLDIPMTTPEYVPCTCNGLRMFKMMGLPLSPAWCNRIGMSMTQLESLTVTELRRPECLQHLKRLRILRMESPISDAGASFLSTLKLHKLYINGKHLTEAGYREVSRVRALRTLCVCEGTLTNMAAQCLAAMPCLCELSLLKSFEFGDSALHTLSAAATLRELSIEVSKFIDASALCRMKQLRSLSILGYWSVSEQAVHEVRRSLEPACSVHATTGIGAAVMGAPRV